MRVRLLLLKSVCTWVRARLTCPVVASGGSSSGWWLCAHVVSQHAVWLLQVAQHAVWLLQVAVSGRRTAAWFPRRRAVLLPGVPGRPGRRRLAGAQERTEARRLQAHAHYGECFIYVYLRNFLYPKILKAFSCTIFSKSYCLTLNTLINSRLDINF